MKRSSLSQLARRTGEPPISWLMKLTLDHPRLVSLAAGFTDNDSLPLKETRELLKVVLSSAGVGRSALQYGSTVGDPMLRELTAGHVRASDEGRDARVHDPARTIITGGSQQLLYMTTEALCDHGDIVLVEDPTYFVYLGITQSHGLRCRGVRMADDGIDLDHLVEVLDGLKRNGQLRRVKLLYLVTYFQNPTGRTTNWAKKAAALKLLRQYERAAGHAIYLVEDAAYRELRFSGDDERSALASDFTDRVIYAGTYSKPFATGARVGFGILPEPVFSAVSRIKGNHDFGTSNLLQQLLSRALETGAYERHLPVLRCQSRADGECDSKTFPSRGEMGRTTWRALRLGAVARAREIRCEVKVIPDSAETRCALCARRTLLLQRCQPPQAEFRNAPELWRSTRQRNSARHRAFGPCDRRAVVIPGAHHESARLLNPARALKIGAMIYPRRYFEGMLVALLSVACVAAGAQPKPARVPPPGIVIAENDRAELRTGADALAHEIASLHSSVLHELLPDVEIYHKAVDWALRYDEFYRSNEVSIARTLLKQGMERAQQLRDGKPSWLTATGLVVRGYLSKIDGSIQPYGLVVPTSFRAGGSNVHRLDVWLHGRDNNLTELKFISDRQRSYGEFTPADTFVLHPYGRYCNAFKFAGEVDVFEAMEHTKKSYRIADRRIALRGFSMGGAGAWHLAAHHPDVWAVAAPGAGFAETAEYQKLGTNKERFPSWEQKLWQLYDATDYAVNFFNLPVIAYNGTDDPQRQAADVMERAMKAEGLKLPRVWGTNVGHKYTPEAKREVSSFVDRVMVRGKNPVPREVHFTTRTLRYNRAPEITVARLENHWQRADVHLKLAPDYSVTVWTTNVAELWLDLPNRGVDNSKVTIDGQLIKRAGPSGSIGVVLFPYLRKDSEGRWSQILEPGSNAPIAKVHGLQGPIDDAFMDSFLMVRPTGTAQKEKVGEWILSQLAKATNEWRAQFRGDARVKDDSQVTAADIATHNLILWGDPQSNRLLARIADKLPIRWTAETVRVGDKSFPSATHVPVFIFPNPLNPQRYVVLNSGFTFAEAGTASNAQQTPKLPDYAVLNIEQGRAVVLADFFDGQWRLQ